MNGPSRLKKVVFGILATTLSFLLLIACLELVLRFKKDPLLMHNLAMSRIMHYESGYGMVLEPNRVIEYQLPTGEARHTIRINAQGFRMDRSISMKPEPGVHRILVLGDSMTFGLGVEGWQSYPAQTERLLNRTRSGRFYEVVNAGFASGICPLPQYLFLKDRGLELDPSMVVVGFFPKNDLKDMWKYKEVLDEKGLPVDVITPGQHIPHFFKKTALYQYLGIMQLQDFVRNLLKRQREEALQDQGSDVVDSYGKIEEVKRVFRWMQALAGEQEIHLIIMFIPAYSDLFEDSLEKFDRLRTDFIDLFQKEHIDYLDPSPFLKRAGRGSYFPLDRHFTATGHHAVAEALCDHILSLRLKGSEPRRKERTNGSVRESGRSGGPVNGR